MTYIYIEYREQCMQIMQNIFILKYVLIYNLCSLNDLCNISIIVETSGFIKLEYLISNLASKVLVKYSTM